MDGTIARLISAARSSWDRLVSMNPVRVGSLCVGADHDDEAGTPFGYGTAEWKSATQGSAVPVGSASTWMARDVGADRAVGRAGAMLVDEAFPYFTDRDCGVCFDHRVDVMVKVVQAATLRSWVLFVRWLVGFEVVHLVGIPRPPERARVIPLPAAGAFHTRFMARRTSALLRAGQMPFFSGARLHYEKARGDLRTPLARGSPTGAAPLTGAGRGDGTAGAAGRDPPRGPVLASSPTGAGWATRRLRPMHGTPL
jgi:hypothetical protein